MFLFFLFFFFPLLFTLIGIGCIALHFHNKKKKGLCTGTTTGKVIGISRNREYRSTGPRRGYRHPRFEYFVNDRRYTILGYSAKLYPVGSTATIYYNPASPDMAYTEEKDHSLFFAFLFFLVAVLYIIIIGVLLKIVIYLP